MTQKFFAMVIASTLFTVAALAAPIALEGKAKFNFEANKLRVGVFALDRAGKVSQEMSSTKIQNSVFALELPETKPETTSYALSTEQIDWPGLVGKVTLTGTTKVVRANLQAYLDNDNSGGFTPADKLLESFTTRERGGMVLLWSETKFSVQAERGFNANIEPGWNVLSIELGKQVDVKKVETMKNLTLEIFNR